MGIGASKSKEKTPKIYLWYKVLIFCYKADNVNKAWTSFVP
jgi:hypothetical protein